MNGANPRKPLRFSSIEDATIARHREERSAGFRGQQLRSQSCAGGRAGSTAKIAPPREVLPSASIPATG